MKRAKETGRFDFDAPIEGLQALDRYTIRIKLVSPTTRSPTCSRCRATAALAREVVEHYGEDIAVHPVGTGPFLHEGVGARLARGARGQSRLPRGVLRRRARPRRGEPRDPRAPAGQEACRSSGRIEIYTVDEAQPRWLAFLNGEHRVHPPGARGVRARRASRAASSRPTSRRRATTLTPDEVAYTTYTTLNTAEKIGDEPNAHRRLHARARRAAPRDRARRGASTSRSRSSTRTSRRARTRRCRPRSRGTTRRS